MSDDGDATLRRWKLLMALLWVAPAFSESMSPPRLRLIQKSGQALDAAGPNRIADDAPAEGR